VVLFSSYFKINASTYDQAKKADVFGVMSFSMEELISGTASGWYYLLERTSGVPGHVSVPAARLPVCERFFAVSFFFSFLLPPSNH